MERLFCNHLYSDKNYHGVWDVFYRWRILYAIIIFKQEPKLAANSKLEEIFSVTVRGNN